MGFIIELETNKKIRCTKHRYHYSFKTADCY